MVDVFKWAPLGVAKVEFEWMLPFFLISLVAPMTRIGEYS